MLNLQLKIKTREIASRKENYSCGTFIYKPKNIEEAALGTLFIIGEINRNRAANKEYSYITNQIASRMKKEYYSRETQNPYKNFQEAIKTINSFLSQFADKKNSSGAITADITIAAQVGQNFYFTAVGKPKIFLFRGGNLLEIDKKLLSGKNSSPNRTFVNIASGQLIPRDILLFAGPNFIEIFPQKILKETIENNNFEEIHKYVSEIISKAGYLKSCGVILVELTEEKGITVRSSYKELQKINDENANQKTTMVIPADESSTASLKRNNGLARLETLRQFLKYIKATTKRLINWLLKIILKKFTPLESHHRKVVITNNKKIILIFLIITLIAIVIIYLARQESVIFIK